MAEYSKKIVKGSVALISLTIVSIFASYLFRIMLAKRVSVKEYGLFYAVYALYGFMILFQNMGLDKTLAKFIPEYLHNKKFQKIKGIMMFVFGIQSFFSLLAAIAVILLSNFLAVSYFKDGQAVPILVILMISFVVLNLHSVIMYSFQGFQKMGLYAAMDAVKAIGLLVFASLFLNIGIGIVSAPLAHLFIFVVTAAIFLPILLKKVFPSFLSIKSELSKQDAIRYIKFGLTILVTIAAGLLITYTDTLMLTFFKTLEDVGLYNVALPTASILWYIPLSIALVIFPLVSEMSAKGEKEHLKKGIIDLERYILLIIVPLSIGLCIYSDIVIKLFFGAEYLPATTALRILCLGGIAYSIAILNDYILVGMGKPKVISIITIVAAIFNFSMNLILIPLWGIAGAAAATAASFSVIAALSAIQLNKAIKKKFQAALYLKASLSAAAFLLVCYAASSIIDLGSGLADALASLFIAAAAYILVAYAVGMIKKEDMIRFKEGLS